MGEEGANFHGFVNDESLRNLFWCFLCIFYYRNSPILKTLGQFEKLGFVIMSTRENIRLIARAPLDMFALEANVLFIAMQGCTLFLLFRSGSNIVKPQQLEPWYIEASAHMSNRIYDTLDSEYWVYFLICNVSWVLKRTISTIRLFLCIQNAHFLR